MSRREVLITNCIVVNNLLVAVADICAGSEICPQIQNSKISKQYHCTKTKTSCILNRALAQSFHVDLVLKMKSNPYMCTLATDRSNDSDLA